MYVTILAKKKYKTTSSPAQLQASRVEAEVSTWAQQYRRAVEAHGVALSTAAARARAKYRLKYREHQHALERRAAQAEQAVKFADEVRLT